MIQMSWTDPTAENTANTFAKELRDQVVKTSGYPALQTYVNYAHGDETLEQRFGPDKLQRLKQLKQTYDPKNLFGYYHGI